MMRISLIALLFSGLLIADSIEVKTGSGVRANLHDVKNASISPDTHDFPWVCYEKRVKVVVDGQMYLTYKDCMRVTASCESVGRAHFGKYPNDYASYQALQRCKNARPRFVD